MPHIKDSVVNAVADEITAGIQSGDQTEALARINHELQKSHGFNNDLELIQRINLRLIMCGQLPALSITPDGGDEIVVGVNASLRRAHEIGMTSDNLHPHMIRPKADQRADAERRADDTVIRSFTSLSRFEPKEGFFSPVMPPGFEHDNLSTAPLPILNRDGSVTRPVDRDIDGVHYHGEQRLAQNGKLKSSTMDYEPPIDLPIQGPNGRNATLRGVSNVETRMQRDGSYETIVFSESGNYRLITDARGVVRSAQPVRHQEQGDFPSITPTENRYVPPRPRTPAPSADQPSEPALPAKPEPAPAEPEPVPAKPEPTPAKQTENIQPQQAPTHDSVFEYINNNFGFIDKNEDGISADEIDEYISSRKSLSEGTVRRLLEFKNRITKLAAAKDEWGFDTNVTRADLQESQLSAGMLQFAIKNWNELAGDDGRITADDIKIFAASHRDLSPEQQVLLEKLRDSLDSLAEADDSDNDASGVTGNDIFKYEEQHGLDANLSQAFQGY